jgi:hypothetical protein
MIDLDSHHIVMWRKVTEAGISNADMLMAAHEVGHAIVARETGLTPVKLVIRQFWSGDGYCEIKEGAIQGDDQSRALLQTYTAGIEAEALWAEQMGLPAPVGTDVYDVEFYDDFCTENDFDYPKEEARGVAISILSSSGIWAELESLALDLGKSGSMNGSAL